MCSGPVGGNQSYWGLIKVTGDKGDLSAEDLKNFKRDMNAFLDGHQGVNAKLANGTIKLDDENDGTSIQLFDRN